MDGTQYQNFLVLAQVAAIVMRENAEYMKQELPRVDLPEGMRTKIEESCELLIGTQENALSAIKALENDRESSASASKQSARGEQLLDQLFAPLADLHPTIETLQELSQQDSRFLLASVLVSESAANILRRFAQAKEAFQSWSADQETAD